MEPALRVSVLSDWTLVRYLLLICLFALLLVYLEPKLGFNRSLSYICTVTGVLLMVFVMVLHLLGKSLIVYPFIYLIISFYFYNNCMLLIQDVRSSNLNLYAYKDHKCHAA